jgi:hypothetical protein
MGWFHEELPSHEGHVTGYVDRDGALSRSGLYRELVYQPADQRRCKVLFLGAACECGWRSPRFQPSVFEPPTWSPYCVSACERDEERALQLWQEHLAHVRAAPRRSHP